MYLCNPKKPGKATESRNTAPGVSIRKMEQRDVSEVGRLEAATFSMPWSPQGFQAALEGGSTIFLVAEMEEKLLGYCGLYRGADEGEITNVAVAEAARGHGIGKRLMERLLQEAWDSGVRRVFLEVRVSNQAALHLYEAFGFSVVGIRRGFYEQPKEDGYVMLLQPEASSSDRSQ